VAGVALHDIHLRFAWQEWRLRHWAGSGGTLGRRLGAAGRAVTLRHFAWQVWHLAASTFTLRGRRGASRHQPAFFAWQAWHLRHWAGSAGVLGRCLGAAGSAGDIELRFAWQVWRLRHWALHDIDLRFAWQAWRLRHWARRGTLHGRCGTWRHLRHWSGSAAWAPLVAGDAAALCVAGVALGDMDLRFAWQA